MGCQLCRSPLAELVAPSLKQGTSPGCRRLLLPPGEGRAGLSWTVEQISKGSLPAFCKQGGAQPGRAVGLERHNLCVHAHRTARLAPRLPLADCTASKPAAAIAGKGVCTWWVMMVTSEVG